jgi:hypothetical protein
MTSCTMVVWPRMFELKRLLILGISVEDRRPHHGTTICERLIFAFESPARLAGPGPRGARQYPLRFNLASLINAYFASESPALRNPSAVHPERHAHMSRSPPRFRVKSPQYESSEARPSLSYMCTGIRLPVERSVKR